MLRLVPVLLTVVALSGCASTKIDAGSLPIAQIPGFTSADQQRLSDEFVRLYPYEDRDTNKDGCYDRAEFEQRAWVRLMLFDMDGSGTLSSEEFLTARAPILTTRDAYSLEQLKKQSARFFVSDQNEDGQLSRDEAAKRPRQMRASLLSQHFLGGRCQRGVLDD